MADDLTNKGPQDRSRISLLEPHEVQYWADKFNVSKERLSEAVRNVGGAFCGRRRKRTEKISLESLPNDHPTALRCRGADTVYHIRTGSEEEAMSISVAQSRTPSRAYVFRPRWKVRFQ